MKTKSFCFLVVLILFFSFAFSSNTAQGAPQNKGINTLQTMVSYDDLEQIMKKDLGKYFLLPLSEYEELKAKKEENIKKLEEIKSDTPPPIDFKLKSANIFANIKDNLAFVEAKFNIEKLTDKHIEIPLLTGKIAIKNAFLNSQEVFLSSKIRPQTRRPNVRWTPQSSQPTRENNLSQWQESQFLLPITSKGTQECTINFIVPIEGIEDYHKLAFNSFPTPITFFKLEMANYNMSITSSSIGDYSLFNDRANTKTELIGWVGAKEKIELTWRQKPISPPEPVIKEKVKEKDKKEAVEETKEELEPEPEIIKPAVILTPLVYANSHTLISVGQTTVYGQKDIVYSISKAPISKLTFNIPENLEISKVQGAGQISHRIMRENNQNFLEVDLQARRMDHYSLKIFYELPVKAETETIAIPEISPTNIERELGSVAIESISTAELQGHNNEDNPLAQGVHPIDPLELPNKLKALATRPIILAFTHSTSPTNINLMVRRYDPVKQITVAADEVEMATTFTTNSTSNTQINLNIRNNAKQYLLMQLASGSEVVSTLRNGKPIKTVSGKLPGMVQIPLEISQVPHKPTSMNLQITLKNVISPMTWNGGLDFEAPQFDIPISNFHWNIYGPENYHLFNFSGTVNKPKDNNTPFFIEGFGDIIYIIKRISREPALVKSLIAFTLIIIFMFFGKYAFALLKWFLELFKGLFTKGLKANALSYMVIAAVLAVGFVYLATPNFKKARTQARDKACYSNIRVIEGAIEMYEMDEGNMGRLDLAMLSQKGYMRGVPKCPEQNGEYSMTKDKKIYCSIHGSIAEQNVNKLKSQDYKRFQSFELGKVATYRDEPGSGFQDQSLAKPQVVPQRLRKPLAPTKPAQTKGFGSTKRTEMLPIKSVFVTTNNAHSLTRELIIPEINGDSSFKSNITQPKVKLYYIYGKIIKLLNLLAFVLALIAGLFIAASAANKQKSKLIAAIVILVALSCIDIKLEGIGSAANQGFWLAIGIALIWKTLMIIKSSNLFTNNDTMFIPLDNLDDPVDPIGPTKPEKPKGSTNINKDGKSNLTILLLITLMIVLTPIISIGKNKETENSNKEIRILAPFKSLSNIIPDDGKSVFLTEEDYNYLKDIKPIKEEKETEAPYLFRLNTVKYQAEVEKNGLRIKAVFDLELHKKDWKSIPILPIEVIPTEAKVNNKPYALNVIRGNEGKKYYGIITNNEGQKRVEINFFVETNKEGDTQSNIFTLNTVPTTTTLLELYVPRAESFALLNPGVIKDRKTTEGFTKFRGLIPPTQAFSLELFTETKEEPQEEKEAEEPKEKPIETPKIVVVEEPTRVSVRTNSLVDVKESFVSLISNVELNIRGSKGISSFTMALPDGVRVTDVSNPAVIENWEQLSTQEGAHLEVSFNSLIKGVYRLRVTIESELIGDKEKEYSVPELIPIGVDQSQGMLGIGCLDHLEVNLVGSPEGYSLINTGDFSRIWQDSTTEKLPYAFRYLKHPNKLVLTVSRPETIEMLSATIDKAEAVSLIHDDGYVITRVKYELRNNSEQFLKVKLPKIGDEEVELWDSRAAGIPVNTGFDKVTESHNIPIIISPLVAGEAFPYYAEVTYAYKTNGMLTNTGKERLELPRVHLPISELEWGVYTNNHKEAIKVDGNLDIMERSQLDFVYNYDSPVTSALPNKGQGQESTGILPIRFQLPLGYEHASFKALQLEPDREAPFLKLMLIGPSKSKTLSYKLMFTLLGLIIATSLIKIFRSSKKLLWLASTIVFGTIAYLAMELKVYGANFSMEGFLISIILYLIWKYFSKETNLVTE